MSALDALLGIFALVALVCWAAGLYYCYRMRDED